MSMASLPDIIAPTAAPISSLKYGNCQVSGACTTPSSEMNRPDLMVPIVVSFASVVPGLGTQHRRVEQATTTSTKWWGGTFGRCRPTIFLTLHWSAQGDPGVVN